MEISTRTKGKVEIVSLAGRATLETHELLRAAFRNAIRCGRSSFVLDLTHTATLDSMTLGELVACLKRAREHGGQLMLLVSPGGSVHEVLQLTGLDRVLQIYGEANEAMAALDSAGC